MVTRFTTQDSYFTPVKVIPQLLISRLLKRFEPPTLRSKSAEHCLSLLGWFQAIDLYRAEEPQVLYIRKQNGSTIEVVWVQFNGIVFVYEGKASAFIMCFLFFSKSLLQVKLFTIRSF